MVYMQSSATYAIHYVYENPSPAGPYKGRTTQATPASKGDIIRAVMGSAIVVSCRRMSVPEPDAMAHVGCPAFGDGEGDR